MIRGKKQVVCATGEVATTYESYLKTNHWRTLRLKVAEAHSYTCIRCFNVVRVGFHIHHNTYKRLGKEDIKDLAFYCQRCHIMLHNNRKQKSKYNKQYHNIIANKLKDMSDEQVQKVIEYIDRVKEEEGSF